MEVPSGRTGDNNVFKWEDSGGEAECVCVCVCRALVFPMVVVCM